MKRMRFFVVLSLLFFSVVGGFATIEKASAQAQPFEKAKQYVLAQFGAGEAVFQNKYSDAQKAVYAQELGNLTTILSDTLATYQKTKPTAPEKDFQLEALGAFIDHLRFVLKDPIDTQTDQVRKDAEQLAQNLYSAISTDNLDNGMMQALGGGFTTNTAASVQNANAANLAQTKTNGAPVEDTTGCTNLTNFSVTSCLAKGVVWLIKTFLLNIAGFFVWVSANMLNYAIQVGILNFSQWAPTSLYPIWVVIRQIVSLFIVFAGLWLGFMYIINKGNAFESYLPWVVIFALFVNFSYPLTRSVIDLSNVISLNLYASTVGADALGAGITSPNTAGALIMNRLGLQGLILGATKSETANNSASLTNTNTIAGSLMAVAFVFYAAYIFFMVTWLLVTRTAVLVFLIIASPLLFVDSVIPKLGDQAAKLRGIFWEMLFVAPVFMIMLALTLKFLEVFSMAAKAGGTTGDGTIVEFFNILMMLIMLHIMLKVTKATAGTIGQEVSSMMGKVGGYAAGGLGGIALGGTGMLGRATIGRGAAKFRDSDWMEKRQGSFLGRKMFTMTDAVAKSGFDARNTSYVQKGAGKLGIGLGMGQKMGREALIEARDKNLEAHLNRIGTHKRNIYNPDGTLKNKKGSLNTEDAEAMQFRREFATTAGNSLFTTQQQRLDTANKLREANKGQESAEVAQIVKDFGELKRANPADKIKIDSLLAQYAGNAKITKKLKEAYSKNISDEFAALGNDTVAKEEFINKLNGPDSSPLDHELGVSITNLDAKNSLVEYKNQPTEAAKLDFKNKQLATTQAAITEYVNKINAEEQRKIQHDNDTLAASNALAAEQARTTQAITDLAAAL